MGIHTDDQRLDIVRERADQWAKELIDLDHRNTLLNFRSPETASLTLTTCDPAAISGLLGGRKTGFRALFETDDEHQAACTRARSLHRKIVAFREEQGIDAGRVACGLVRTYPARSAGTRPALALRAPLLLRSVEIHAKTAAESDFTIQAGVEVEINPVLLHALQREYGLDCDLEEIVSKVNTLVAELAEPDEQVEQAFAELTEHANRQGIALELEQAVVVGLFNYQKLPMVLDLTSATELLAEHDLIAAIAGHAAAAETVRGVGYTPPEVDTIHPRNEHLPHDANSSQHRAIETALAGRHLLIEGPPGTGKSQTIANIIASAAARGQRVLFVAEKRAAIEAVTNRLADVDLADLVLDLHTSSGSKKKHVAKQLAESLSRAARQGPVDATELHRVLVDRRERLSGLARELHELRAPWDRSAYQVREELLRIGAGAASTCRFTGYQLATLNAEIVPQVQDRLQVFVEQGGLRILRSESPWAHADVKNTDDARRVLAELEQLAGTTLRGSRSRMQQLVSQVGLPVPREIAGWQRVLSLLDGVAASVQTFGPDIFGDHLDVLYYATAPRAERARSPHQMPWRQRRALAKQARLMCQTGVKRKVELNQALGTVVAQRNSWRELGGPQSRPALVVGLTEMMADYEHLRRQLASVALSAQVGELETRPTEQVQAKLDELHGDREMVFHLPRITQLRQWFTGLGLDFLLNEIAQRDASPEEARLVFRRAWLSSLDDEFKLTSSVLREFTAEQQDRLVAEFQQADTDHRKSAAERVRRKVAVAMRQARDDYPQEAEILQREAEKKARHLPLRRLVERAPHVLLALRPCWAMSPLVVSQTLPASRLFDLVIFDEASQIQPHDAITSIMRGHRLVVAGDDKQLPPSTWFERVLGGDDDGDGEESDLRDYESILTSLRPIIPHRNRLQWHYRSQDERLIAFSNQEVYNGDLVTFPGARHESPLRLEVVDGTASPGQGGLPAEEVHRLVELIIEHAEQRPTESLGVITLGVMHQARVEQALREALRDRRDLDEFFSEDAGPTHRFFVKNIETVQGDERDAIILSVGVARKANGEVSRTAFGALNRERTERRVNVAVTRAKRRMTVVSSFPPAALAPSDKLNGTEMLRRYLEAAERDGDPSSVGRRTDTDPNGLEEDIARRLAAHGVTAHPQWGVSDYRIDFALAHPREPGRMVLAVEADGDTYHRATSTRDRDRLRQEHLQRLGWKFHRVWASAWFSDPEREAQRIIGAWRAAVAEHDAEWHDPSPPRALARLGLRIPESPIAAQPSEPNPVPTPAVQRPSGRGPQPDVPYGLPIDDYTKRELIALCRWLVSDRLPLDRQQRITQAMDELGFQRRGKKIVERLGRAVDIAQNLADKEEH